MEKSEGKKGAPKKLVIIISLVVSVMIISLAVTTTERDSRPALERRVLKSELAKADGKNGHPCLVAVAGTVYQIENQPLWQNGEHLTSKGLAFCGADLSKIINQSPHGRKVLQELDIIGPLVE